MNAPNQPSRQDSMSPQSSLSTDQSPTNQMAPPPQAPSALAPSTEAFLRDFTLVAEAAKRAQMAVMMRDFEACGLS
ncbi:thiol methyltransferase [Colletotrichum camelliae]|nr:thiol methyltransferase [Colletotrichum camelliae]